MRKKYTAVWGTGLTATKFAENLGKEKINFFIDNNAKKGEKFLSKKVLSPLEIKNWKEIFIYIPYRFKEEIGNQLKGYGLSLDLDYSVYKYEINRKFSLSDLLESLDNLIKEIKKNEKFMNSIPIFTGVLAIPKRDVFIKLYNLLAKQIKGEKFVFFSEATWLPEKEMQSNIDFPLKTLPSIFSMEYPNNNEALIVNAEIMKVVRESNYLMETVINLRMSHTDMQENYEYIYAYYMDFFLREVLSCLKPKSVIMWSSLSVPHRILYYVCKDLNIPMIMMHEGVFYGTIHLDTHGDQGEGIPATYSEQFKKLPITEAEYNQTEQYLEYFRTSRLNRRIQPKIEKDIQCLCSKNSPTILLLGMVDYEMGTIPYSDRVKHNFSPFFKTSNELAIYLADIAEKNDWNLIYKEHPAMVKFSKTSDLPSSITKIENVDINDIIDAADVVVNIMSSTDYVSLIRNVPVVSVGYTALKDKDCTYQVNSKSDIEFQIKLALKYGFSEKQREAFIRHSAQLMKYYLYDDLSDKEVICGRKLPNSLEDIFALERELKSK